MFSNSKIFARSFIAATLTLLSFAAQAAVGLTEIAGAEGDGPITLYYPSSSEAKPVAIGPFTLNVAAQGTPVRGNGRLIVISHGSGGSPSVHFDLARVLVEDGFIVAMPEHSGDN